MRQQKKVVNLICWLLFVLSAASETGGMTGFESPLPLLRSQQKSKPNIVIIMADDMGHNDVSYNGMNQFLTPNIDALAYHGTILNKFYVPPMCTPSRSALMTGKHALRTGMQHFVISNDEPWGLCPKEKLMPKYFQEAGYSTNLIGKWHLGFFKKAYTPTERGFDYHYGYMGGYIDYYDHSLIMLNRNYSRGHDFYRNLEQSYEGDGIYATDLLTDEAIRVINKHKTTSKPLFLMLNHLAPHTGNENNPMQAPPEEIQKFQYIQNMKRRTYAAMVSKLDDSIGRIMEALQRTNMLSNTIVVFYCDNGAPTIGLHSNSGSNYPFKGQKNSPWEGALRVPAIIYSPLWKHQSYVSQQVMHVTDLLPTLAAAAGIQIEDGGRQLDGINLLKTLQNNNPIIYRRILHNIDDVFGYSAYLRGPWKYINGTTINGAADLWLGEITKEIDPRALNYEQTILQSKVAQVLSKNQILYHKNQQINTKLIRSLRQQTAIYCPNYPIFNNQPEMECKPLIAPCLFNIDIDPCEHYNFANTSPGIMQFMERDIMEYRRNAAVKTVIQKPDPKSDPALHFGEWTWWQDDSNCNFGMPGTYCI